MKLRRLSLRNFRQYKGDQTFPLDTSSEKPVVLVFGANGSGKTTLLTAFTWVLYGDVSEDVEEQHRMINDDVWRATGVGDRAIMEVELEFEHGGDGYVARRAVSVRKEGDQQQAAQGTLSLWRTTRHGVNEEVPGPQSVIDTILPRPLSRFFFFNGERIEKITQRSTYVEVRKDVKILLGLETVERALRHLPRVEKRLGADVRKYGGDQAARLQDDIDAAKDAAEQASEQADRSEREIESLTTEREAVEEKLREHAAAAPIQRERDRLKKNLDQARTAHHAALQERQRLVAERGFIAFTGQLAKETGRLANALYEKGALPAPLKREFVDNLVESGECICGTALTQGSVPWQKVTSWRERAGLVEVETAWQRLSGQVEQIDSARTQLRDSLSAATKHLDEETRRVEELEDELSERNTELDRIGRQATDVGALEAKRIDLDKRLARLELQRSDHLKEADAKRTQAESLERQLQAAEVKDEIALTARRRVSAISHVESALREILAIREEKMRDRLDAQIKETFQRISMKPYVPELTGDFDLWLYDETEGEKLPVAKSTGENQILSLSFVASVSKLAQEVRKEKIIEQGDSDFGDYPIVMDAAFGSLDERYQRDVAQALGEMASQLIVFVSKSQGLGQVYGELEHKLNHVGVIVAHSSNASQPAETIAIMGRQYPYFETGADSTWSELREVTP